MITVGSWFSVVISRLLFGRWFAGLGEVFSTQSHKLSWLDGDWCTFFKEKHHVQTNRFFGLIQVAFHLFFFFQREMMEKELEPTPWNNLHLDFKRLISTNVLLLGIRYIWISHFLSLENSHLELGCPSFIRMNLYSYFYLVLFPPWVSVQIVAAKEKNCRFCNLHSNYTK